MSHVVCACSTCKDSQRAGGQVGVFVLQLSVQRQTSFLSVVGQKRSERKNFTEGRTGSDDVTDGTRTSTLTDQ